MDIEKCRICLENTNLLINLFNDINSPMISYKIMTLAKVEIYPNDGLPVSICINCNNKLNDCIEFINLCKKSDKDLRNFIINNKIQQENKTSSGHKHIKDEYNLTPNVESKATEKELDEEVGIEDKKVTLDKYSSLCDQSRLSQKHQCFTCGKIMSSSHRLKTHLATHLKEKPHSCSYCKKKFTIVENLNVHMRIHTGEKPYCCTICGEKFARSSGLIVHKRKHTGQMPYQCVLCPRSFQTLGHFKYHIRAHTGERNYNCSTCGRSFITSGDLKQHIVTHGGEKQHVCCVCGVRFSRASNLKRHVKYLHNEKTFTCEQCPSKCIQRSDLAKHQSNHKTE